MTKHDDNLETLRLARRRILELERKLEEAHDAMLEEAATHVEHLAAAADREDGHDVVLLEAAKSLRARKKGK